LPEIPFGASPLLRIERAPGPRRDARLLADIPTDLLGYRTPRFRISCNKLRLHAGRVQRGNGVEAHTGEADRLGVSGRRPHSLTPA
jgi:hypothetical protein